MLRSTALGLCCFVALACDLTRASGQDNASQQSRNNLKQQLLAMHNYHDVNGHFPPAAVLGPDGKTLHSWRVALLPFLDKQALYEQYKQNEAWDSPHNKALLSQMPDVFRYPSEDSSTTDSAYYVCVGPGAAFEGKKGMRIRDFTDGTSNTILIVEAKRGIPWTKPDDIPFDPQKPVPKLGGFDGTRFQVGAADGAARRLDQRLDQQTLKDLIQRNDGHLVDWPH
jgi:Protein of unknown function (DUF1559)